MAEDLLPRILKAYRQDVKTGKLETLPIKLDRAQLIDIASGMQQAVKEGMPKIGLDNLPKKVLLEGRADAGTNEYNNQNKAAEALYKKLTEAGAPEISAKYAAAVLDKSQVASRLGIPFEQAWNGTGTSAMTGRTGAQHSDRATKFGSPELDPKNSELLDTIRRAAAGNLTPQENIVRMDRADKLLPALLNLPEGTKATEPRDGGTFYTQKAIDAAQEKIYKARKEATPEERAASKLTYGSDLLRVLPDAYAEASGVEAQKSVWGRMKDLDDPILKYIVGNAPKKPEPVQEPGLLDKIVSFFTGTK